MVVPGLGDSWDGRGPVGWGRGRGLLDRWLMGLLDRRLLGLLDWRGLANCCRCRITMCVLACPSLNC